MKRIASLFLFGVVLLLCTCTNERVDPEPVTHKKTGSISLKVLVPTGSISTYADTDASKKENHIDTLYVDLYQGGQLIEESKFFGTQLELAVAQNTNDSILTVDYEVDDITTGTLTAKVYANYKKIKVITEEIPIPEGTPASPGDPITSFFMSGEEVTLLYNGTAYEGTVHLVRNVAKVRVNISKNLVVLPSDLEIDYSNVQIRVCNVANQTSWLQSAPANEASTQPGFGYISYAPRGPAPLKGLRHSPSFKSTPSSPGAGDDGGQIDSCYVYENFRNSYVYDEENPIGGTNNVTVVEIMIPTISSTGGAKEAKYTYALFANNSYTLKRNYIYTLDIKVRGQSLEPVITVSVLPWDDVNVDGNIYGTYLTLDKSEIEFDESGEAHINFCTDAQAVYFDYERDFNNSNSVKIPSDKISTIGIDLNNGLAPDGFKSGQILLDQQHCGSFGFKLLDLDDNFPEFPEINFSGRIRMKAGNIVKYLTFPAKRIYDAHFIVGDSILGIDSIYKNATVSPNANWLKISKNRIYASANMMDSYTSSQSSGEKLYLHLDENLTGSTRTGSITVNRDGSEKKLNISQLSAIPVGRFGHNTTTDDSIFSTTLFTEQLYEFKTMPQYIKTENNLPIPVNAIYNGRTTATSDLIFTGADYNNNLNYFNYQNALYQAINYCAYKNRITGTEPLATELKWYLPSQAQLMGMWLSFTSYKDITTSNFKYKYNDEVHVADYFWSSTDNKDYSNYAQYMNFEFGNIGHNTRMSKHWVRCVRDSTTSSTSMIITTANVPVIDFGIGMPAGSYNTSSKFDGIGDEFSDNNKTLYKKLRVALNDHASGVEWNLGACDGYSEDGAAANTWRLPTQRELQAIWILQSEIKAKLPAFTLLADEYYWSATVSNRTSGTHAWTIFGSRSRLYPGSSGNAPAQPISMPLHVRCVHEE